MLLNLVLPGEASQNKHTEEHKLAGPAIEMNDSEEDEEFLPKQDKAVRNSHLQMLCSR